MSRDERVREIERAIETGDLGGLRRLATEGEDGLVTKDLRARAWPILLGVTGGPQDRKRERDTARVDWRDASQVQLDVDRSFIGFLESECPREEKEVRMRQLGEILYRVCAAHPGLHYFQGLHDIISILLLIIGPNVVVKADDETYDAGTDAELDLVADCAVRLCLFWVRDAMMQSLDPIFGYLRLIKRLLAVADPEYFKVVRKTSSLPYFTLSWLLTLFAHDVSSIPLISRLFDLFIANGPAMPVYLAVAVVLERRKEVEEWVESEGNQIDPATLHTILAKLPTIVLRQDEERMEPKQGQETHNHDPETMSEEKKENAEPAATDRAALSDVTSIEQKPDVDDTRGLVGRSDSDHSSEPPSTHGRLEFARLLSATLKIHHLFPPSHDCIRVEEVLGPKSALRTWKETSTGIFGVREAEEALGQMDLVALIPEDTDDELGEIADDDTPEDQVLEEFGESQAVEDGWEKIEKITPKSIAKSRLKKRSHHIKALKRRQRRQMEMTVGGFIAIAGVAGVALALYGDPRKEAPMMGTSGGGERKGIAWAGRALYELSAAISDILSPA